MADRQAEKAKVDDDMAGSKETEERGCRENSENNVVYIRKNKKARHGCPTSEHQEDTRDVQENDPEASKNDGRRETRNHTNATQDVSENDPEASKNVGRRETRNSSKGKEVAPKQAPGPSKLAGRRATTSASVVGRNRASPARLYKLNDAITSTQKTFLYGKHAAGLLDVHESMPTDLSMWLIRCFDPNTCELVIPDRGRIPVNAASVHRNFGLPNSGRKVSYVLDKKVIDWINKEYGIEKGSAPDFSVWCDIIKKMGGACDDKFLRAYYIVALGTFLCPTTSVNISPRCYPCFKDITLLPNTNICQFVVDQIVEAFRNMGDKKLSVCCCVYHLVILYLDSLVHNVRISNCAVRVSAWDSKLISKIIKLDMKSPGVFGKLQLKDQFRNRNEENPEQNIFGNMDRVEEFVSSKLPSTYSASKKRKLNVLVQELFADITKDVGKFVEGVGKLDFEEAATTDNIPVRKSKRRRSEDTDSESEESAKDSDEKVLEDSEQDSSDEETNNASSDGDDDEEENEGEDDDDGEQDDDDEDDESNDSDEGNKQQDTNSDSDDSDGDEDDEDKGTKNPSHNDEDEESDQRGSDEEFDDVETGAKEDSSVSGESPTLGEWLQKKSNEQGERKEPSLLYMVRMEPKEVADPIPMLEVPEIFEERQPSVSQSIVATELAKEKNEVANAPPMIGDTAQISLSQMFKNDIEGVPVHRPVTRSQKKVSETPKKPSQGAVPFKRNLRLAVAKRKVQKKAQGNAPSSPPHATCASSPATLVEKLQPPVTTSAPPPSTTLPNAEQVQQTAVQSTSTSQLPKPGIPHKVVTSADGPATTSDDLATTAVDLATTADDLATVQQKNEHKTDSSHMPAPATSICKPATDHDNLATVYKNLTITIPNPTSEVVRTANIPSPRTGATTSCPEANFARDKAISTGTGPVATPASDVATSPGNVASFRSHVSPSHRASATPPMPSSISPSVARNAAASPQGSLFFSPNSPASATSSPRSGTNSPASVATATSPASVASMSQFCATPGPHSATSDTCPLPPRFPKSRTAATTTTCPPPSPKPGSFIDLTSEDVYRLIDKCTAPKPGGSLVRSSSDGNSAKNVKGKAEENPIQRTSSGSRILYPACDPPPFNLDMDLGDFPSLMRKNADALIGPYEKDIDGWTEEMDVEAFALVDKIEASRKSPAASPAVSPGNFNTPMDASVGASGNASSSSGPGAPPPRERRISKAAACARSPYIDYQTKRTFACSTEVNKIYSAVMTLGRRSSRSQEEDKSPHIVNYNNYFITVCELANSMKPKAWIKNIVFEVGIESLNYSAPKTEKKVIMPLRIAGCLQNMVTDSAEIASKFHRSNKLDKKNMIMLPVLENLNPGGELPCNHYWLFNMNIPDRRFEVFDSLRTLDDPALKKCAQTIIASLRILWDEHYPHSAVNLDGFSLIDIDPPKQNNSDDCGIYTLMNAQLWAGRQIPNYGPAQIPNLRKLLTASWIKSNKNDIPWREVLKIN